MLLTIKKQKISSKSVVEANACIAYLFHTSGVYLKRFKKLTLKMCSFRPLQVTSSRDNWCKYVFIDVHFLIRIQTNCSKDIFLLCLVAMKLNILQNEKVVMQLKYSQCLKVYAVKPGNKLESLVIDICM